MYPFFRMGKEVVKFRNAPALELGETHVSHHICWPWDLDFWFELNNGRTLSIYDLGRIPLATRTGVMKTLKAQKWGLTVAGSSVRYRRRVRAFDRLEMHSRLVTWDARFIFLEQSMWYKGECTSHALFRMAITDRNGIVATDRVMTAMGVETAAPAMPEWVAAWVGAEGQRPWPPMQDAL
ncbi:MULTISPECIES: thioesterase family protein [Falsihalocynthiibacter]|uniref:thioesterase family protein n=1 Tax=Falsihalocynthiibacter TaxID=2854182 RepID=UPI003001AC60